MTPLAARALAGDAWLTSFDRATGATDVRPADAAIANAPGLRVLFSGVLFEIDELADRLGAPRTLTPAALILRAYQDLGDRWIDALRGHFAIVVDDRHRERLTAVRDRMGQHPLFYAEAGSTIYFAPSIDQLLAQPGVSSDFNRVQMAEHLIGRWPVPDETYYAAIKRVRSGHMVEVTRQQLRDTWYWNPSEMEPLAVNEADGQAQFEQHFERAVRRCLDQGPAAINLSGGLDSLSVAAVAQEIAAREGRPSLLATSLGFPDPECNEEFVQRSAGAALGVEHVFVKFGDAVGAEGLLRKSVRMAARRGTPLSNLWWPAYDHLARIARDRGRRVVMTGTGGDEWLTVTPLYTADLLRSGRFLAASRLIGLNARSFKFHPLVTVGRSLWTEGVRPLLTMTVDRYAHDWMTARHRRKMAESVLPWVAPDPALRKAVDDRGPLTVANPQPFRNSFYQREMRLALVHSLVSQEYEEFAESSAAAGVRFLHPYLDADLVEFLYRLPPAVLTRGKRSKGLVRAAVAQRLPKLGFERQRKVSATSFYHSTLRREGQAAWSDVSRGATLAELGIIDAAGVSAAIDRLAGRPTNESYRIWTVLNLASWAGHRHGSANRRGA